IRSLDSQHMITVAVTMPFQDRASAEANELLITSAFTPNYLRDYLDFISVHVYPGTQFSFSTPLDLTLMKIRGAYVGKPVVLEELFVFADSEETEPFYSHSLESASGWVSFYWGTPPEQLRNSNQQLAMMLADGFERYIKFLRDDVPFSGVTRKPAEMEQP